MSDDNAAMKRCPAVLHSMSRPIGRRRRREEEVTLTHTVTVSHTLVTRRGAGLNDGLFSETMDFRDFPSV